ncbi:MAG: acid phosphatase [Burkholderiales bacterium]|nr:acid phosphatase [Burkholderiales bacterium]
MRKLPLFCVAAGALLSQAVCMAGNMAPIQTVVVIYGENRSFNNLYGMFPGASGIEEAMASGAYQQKDRDGSVMQNLPPVWKKHDKIDPRFPTQMPNRPFRVDAAPINLGLDTPSPDLVHRFYQNQIQIDGGKNDMFAAVSDAGALTMAYYDGSRLPMWKLAQQYTLADHFFMGAFGGSFLNHFWLACACTPTYRDAPDSLRAKTDADGKLLLRADSPAHAADGPPRYQDGAITPDGYAVNTMQAPYQPSFITPPADNPALADISKHPLPPQTQTSIGDTLSAKNISWKWYSGGWNRALADRKQIYEGEVKFQVHHQPFNYFLRFAPGTADRAEHLKDGDDFLKDLAAGQLPQVSFYKPQGSLNEHPGYADVLSGDEHIANLVARLQASPQWKHMLIVVTYDENGGFWDHVAPPKADRWGPGSRIPAIIISPYAKKSFVDHTTYDTTSILKFLTKRFDLTPLPGVRAVVGDLSNALID